MKWLTVVQQCCGVGVCACHAKVVTRTGPPAQRQGEQFLARRAAEVARLRRRHSARRLQRAWRAFAATRRPTAALAAAFAASGVPALAGVALPDPAAASGAAPGVAPGAAQPPRAPGSSPERQPAEQLPPPTVAVMGVRVGAGGAAPALVRLGESGPTSVLSPRVYHGGRLLASKSCCGSGCCRTGRAGEARPLAPGARRASTTASSASRPRCRRRARCRPRRHCCGGCSSGCRRRRGPRGRSPRVRRAARAPARAPAATSRACSRACSRARQPRPPSATRRACSSARTCCSRTPRRVPVAAERRELTPCLPCVGPMPAVGNGLLRLL